MPEQFLARLRRHESRRSELRVGLRGAQPARQEVLGRLRAMLQAAQRRRRRTYGLKIKRLAARGRFCRTDASEVRTADAGAAAVRIHLQERATEPRGAPARLLRPARSRTENVHRLRRGVRDHEPARGRVGRGERVGARERAERRTGPRPRRREGGRAGRPGRAVSEKGAYETARGAVAHLRGAGRRQDPRLPDRGRERARRAAPREPRPGARSDVVPGRAPAGAPLRRVPRRGVRRAAVSRRRRLRAGRGSSSGNITAIYCFILSYLISI